MKVVEGIRGHGVEVFAELKAERFFSEWDAVLVFVWRAGLLLGWTFVVFKWAGVYYGVN